MNFRIGQKVSYPNLGICSVESVENKQLGANSVEVYSLKLLADESVIFVPTANAATVRLRSIINSLQCRQMMEYIAADFTEVSCDWKIRSREFGENIQSGDIFKVADVLKKLYFLTHQKHLSFREQRTYEKARFLVISELAAACSQPECQVETKVDNLLKIAFEKHPFTQVPIVSAASN
jgi:CarD family transcriptional regulator